MVSKVFMRALKFGRSEFTGKNCRVFAKRIMDYDPHVVKTVVRNDGTVFKSLFDSSGKQIGKLAQGKTNGFGGVYWSNGVRGSMWDMPF